VIAASAPASSPLPSPPRRGEGAGRTLSDTKRDEQAFVSTLAAPCSTLHAPSTSLPAYSTREYFRTVARLGIQAAEALDHAHQNGILHRDVKPANLLVECSPLAPREGTSHLAERDDYKLWITDFGLARIEQDAGMTMTGDLLGTLRYMSPEQALAKRVVVDHRSDIYSLGVTLYELLTLQPAYAAEDRQELLRQIAFEEPRKPRQINARIPRDLETIILKAIEKNPADRYSTAYELASDLGRFVEDKSITARRPSLAAVVRKWSRRHQAALLASIAVLALTSLILAVSAALILRERNAAVLARDEANRRFVFAKTALGEVWKLSQTQNDPRAVTAASRRMQLLLREVAESDVAVASELIGHIDNLCMELYENGFTQQASELKKEIWRLKAAYIESIPSNALYLTGLAFGLVAWPDAAIRDGEQARRLVERAIAIHVSEDDPAFRRLVWWRPGVLAFAYLRCGAWQSAIDAMERSIALSESVGRSTSGMDWLLLALAHWQLGDEDQARVWYDRAIDLMNEDDYVTDFYEQYFREEVEAVLTESVAADAEASAQAEPQN
jgi:tetratricopeptide (TPR) repeat protein